jgi:hypothetical protein
MLRTPMTSILPPIQSVLELFNGPLSSVRFADIDASGLTNLAAEVEAAASEVQRHEAKLAELRQGLAQRQEALLVLAQQALAYARVYAENDEPLLEELNRISLPRAAKARKPGAAKAAGARDAARSEATTEAASGTGVASGEETALLTLPEPAEADEPALGVDAEGEAGSSETAEAKPARAGRKTRGATSQRATN